MLIGAVLCACCGSEDITEEGAKRYCISKLKRKTLIRTAEPDWLLCSHEVSCVYFSTLSEVQHKERLTKLSKTMNAVLSRCCLGEKDVVLVDCVWRCTQ